MVLTTFALALSIGITADAKPLVCPMMGSPVAKDSPVVEYAGSAYAFCCAGCDAGFSKDPKAALKKNEKNTATIAVFLFDPVSRNAIKPDKAKATTDFKGTRYYFESEANLEAFNKDSKRFTTAPKQESLSCPVMGEKIASYSKASSYVDYKDVRYYICCPGCLPAFTADPDKYAGKAVGEPTAIAQKKG
jgi:YHS domain-containing protein